MFFLEKRTTKSFRKKTTKSFRKKTTKSFRKKTTKSFRKTFNPTLQFSNFQQEGVVGETWVSLRYK
jgi:hypothetical protein